jgi:hypothetical protein
MMVKYNALLSLVFLSLIGQAQINHSFRATGFHLRAPQQLKIGYYNNVFGSYQIDFLTHKTSHQSNISKYYGLTSMIDYSSFNMESFCGNVDYPRAERKQELRLGVMIGIEKYYGFTKKHESRFKWFIATEGQINYALLHELHMLNTITSEKNTIILPINSRYQFGLGFANGLKVRISKSNFLKFSIPLQFFYSPNSPENYYPFFGMLSLRAAYCW